MILAGDVGGTKTRLALYKMQGDEFVCESIEKLHSTKYENVEDLISDFLERKQAKVEYACLGVPGPVYNGVVKITNLPWIIEESSIIRRLEIPMVKLVNDLVATGASLRLLEQKDLDIIYPGSDDRELNIKGVLAPGTGLGQASVVTIGNQDHVLGSEGGHVDFAPRNELEFKMLEYFKTKFKRVSVERIVSGKGLRNVYYFLKECLGYFEPPEVRDKLDSGLDAGAVIAEEALKGDYEICVKTLEIFVTVMGSHAGNMALTYMSTGGMYLGGGIPPKILPKLKDNIFRDAYLNKGRLSYVIESTPVYVIKDDTAALRGAAYIATNL